MLLWLRNKNCVNLLHLFQGGPGGSGTGFGNFEEIGPLDDDLKPRNTSWVWYITCLA